MVTRSEQEMRANPEPGDEIAMSYKEFHELIHDKTMRAPDDDPCDAVFHPSSGSVTWPRYSFCDTGDVYTPSWCYDHNEGVAIFACVGDLIAGLSPEDGEESPEDPLKDLGEEWC